MPLSRIQLPAILLAAQISPTVATAYTQEEVFALWQEYQRFCGQMLATPEQFHTNPDQSFGQTGGTLSYSTEDLSIKDYEMEIVSTSSTYLRGYSMNSAKVSKYIEQSCLVSDLVFSEIPLSIVERLATVIEETFRTSPGFEITGGEYKSTQGQATSDYYGFTISGAFSGQDVLTYLSIGPHGVTIEHTKLTVFSN